jgi:hypothetical protein
VNNNFNCTETEYQQLADYVLKHPNRLFFVNCNIRTPNLITLNNHPYKAVITINPDVTVHEALIERLYEINQERVAFVRVKYVPDRPVIIDLIRELSDEGYNVVVTLQRFNGKKTLDKYAERKHYEFSYNRYRLTHESVNNLLSALKPLRNTYVCDLKGLGCGGCGLCATLTAGTELPIKSLNMSSSGDCPFSCVDCYAKTMQHFLSAIGMPTIKYDVIKRNSKQSGRTEHIKDAKKAIAS